MNGECLTGSTGHLLALTSSCKPGYFEIFFPFPVLFFFPTLTLFVSLQWHLKKKEKTQENLNKFQDFGIALLFDIVHLVWEKLQTPICHFKPSLCNSQYRQQQPYIIGLLLIPPPLSLYISQLEHSNPFSSHYVFLVLPFAEAQYCFSFLIFRENTYLHKSDLLTIKPNSLSL